MRPPSIFSRKRCARILSNPMPCSNWRICASKASKYAEAAELLRKYVRVSRTPAPGYYKLAMVERSLHQTEAAQRDLSVFQTLSKNAPTGPYPYQHLFDYLDNRSNLSGTEKTQLDLTELSAQIQKQPDQPENLYLLAEGYLKLGKSSGGSSSDRSTGSTQRRRLPHANGHRRFVCALPFVRRRHPAFSVRDESQSRF